MAKTMILLAGAFALASAGAQSPPSIRDGVYSEAQAARGAALYQTQCASCHGDKLLGKGPTPPLAGPDFTMNWDGMTVGDLFDKIQASMPADKPGSLSREQNASLIAHILGVNNFPHGATDLSNDVERLRQIRFEATKPK